MKYKFVSYYKYCFTLELENGKTVHNESCDSSDIYRLEVCAEGEAKELTGDDGVTYYLVDGCSFS